MLARNKKWCEQKASRSVSEASRKLRVRSTQVPYSPQKKYYKELKNAEKRPSGAKLTGRIMLPSQTKLPGRERLSSREKMDK